jgi:hypothetical protein
MGKVRKIVKNEERHSKTVKKKSRRNKVGSFPAPNITGKTNACNKVNCTIAQQQVRVPYSVYGNSEAPT